MVTSFVLAAVFIGLLLGALALWSFTLRLGLRWAKVPDATPRRIVLATVVVLTAQTAIQLGFLQFQPLTRLGMARH